MTASSSPPAQDAKRMLKALDKVRAAFGPNGEYWRQGSQFKGNLYCLVNACGRAGANAGIDVMRLLQHTASVDYLHVWNDEEGRTFADVEKLIADARFSLLSQPDNGNKS